MGFDEGILAAAHDGVQAAIDAGIKIGSGEVRKIELSEAASFAHHALMPEGMEVHAFDFEKLLPFPRRKTGAYTTSTVESFAAYVGEHQDVERTTVWVHPTSGAIVAVLNDHGANDEGWGDHRVSLSLLATDEWKHWLGKDNRLLTQVEFAEHVEDGLREIIAPDAADILEIAQKFHATTSAEFRGGQRLASGEVQLTYVEETQASSQNAKGDRIEIPKEFMLRMAPFVGEPEATITARLRYRLAGGKVQLGYKLDRPQDHVRAALEGIRLRLADRFPLVYQGTPNGR